MARLINFCKYFFNVIRCCRGEGNFELHPFFISFLSFKKHGLCCVDYLIIYLFFDSLATCLQNRAFAKILSQTFQLEIARIIPKWFSFSRGSPMSIHLFVSVLPDSF